ncbi:MAG: hypothetical protein M1522_01525 [Actinobacteria bacterium]|nr:hypothetical protein [Actinomycetota bacterium]
MSSMVVYESRSGHTKKAAEAIAAALQARGVEATATAVSATDPASASGADLLVLGTWVEGFIVVGVGPARPAKQWIDRLPQVAGTQAAVFCTYGVSPRGTLATMRSALEARGAGVVGEAAFSRRDPTAGVEAFVEKILAARSS